jgi:diguanylate cyclase (GGDEF)-like protein
MIDLDHFKSLTMTWPSGRHNRAPSVASSITGAIREEDIACRYGGEELTVLLPGCSLADAIDKAETIRSRIEALSQTHSVRVSASIGVAAVPDCSTNAEELLKLADEALYKAKGNGRNNVTTAPTRPGKSLVNVVEMSAAASS